MIIVSHKQKKSRRLSGILKNGILRTKGTSFQVNMGAAFEFYKIIASFSKSKRSIVMIKQTKGEIFFVKLQIPKDHL